MVSDEERREVAAGLRSANLADLIYQGDTSQGRRDIVACDREALLALAAEMETADPEDLNVAIDYVTECASRIREALGVDDG